MDTLFVVLAAAIVSAVLGFLLAALRDDRPIDIVAIRVGPRRRPREKSGAAALSGSQAERAVRPGRRAGGGGP